MFEEQRKSKKRNFEILKGLVTGSPFKMFGGPYDNVFDFIAEGDKKREEEIMFLATKIFHIITLSCAIILLLINMLMLINHDSFENSSFEYNYVVYISSIILLVAGIFWHKVINWRAWSKSTKIGVIFNHFFRIFCFLLVTLLGLLGGIVSLENFIYMIPLYTLSFFCLALTFPTQNK